MKKSVVLIILVLIFLLVIETVKAITITGFAVSEPTNVSITITAANLPEIEIKKPKNEIYMSADNLLLNYTAVNADTVWYHIDSSSNTTITSSIYFNTTQGSHTLYLYANNSQGTTKANVTFTINLDLFTMNFSDWEGEYKGNSTNFYHYSFEELQNLSEIIFENINYGKIYFLEVINLTDDFNPNDGIININDYITTSFNRVEIDSSVLPNFNKSATLRIYNLTFTNPRIAKDGLVCPSTICTKQSYSGGILVFNVTHFTSYEAEETPSEETPSASTSGGGGGGTTIKDFSVDIENIKTSLKQGQTKTEQIIIENTGNTEISLNLQNPTLQNILKISETSFSLNAKETKIINLEFSADKKTPADLYTGKLTVKGEGIEKEISIELKVETKKPLFDIKLEISEKYLYVAPGEEVVANGILYETEDIGKVDVTLDYTIKDFEDNIIIKKQETISVEKEAFFVESFIIPKNVDFGDYVFYVKANYNGETAIASASFSVAKEYPSKKDIILITAIIIMFILLAYVMYQLIKIKAVIKINQDILVKEKLIKIKRG